MESAEHNRIEANTAERVSYEQVADRARQLKRPIPKGRIASPLPSGANAEIPEVVYTSWEDFLERTPDRDIRTWCSRKAQSANRERFMSGKQEHRLTAQQVYDVLFSSQGRCDYCGSLCVERRPSGLNGRPAKWENVGRRIGSLGHKTALMNGGTNDISNLCWSCLWCNVWPSERVMGATDRGGIQANVSQRFTPTLTSPPQEPMS